MKVSAVLVNTWVFAADAEPDHTPLQVIIWQKNLSVIIYRRIIRVNLYKFTKRICDTIAVKVII